MAFISIGFESALLRGVLTQANAHLGTTVADGSENLYISLHTRRADLSEVDDSTFRTSEVGVVTSGTDYARAAIPIKPASDVDPVDPAWNPNGDGSMSNAAAVAFADFTTTGIVVAYGVWRHQTATELVESDNPNFLFGANLSAPIPAGTRRISLPKGTIVLAIAGQAA